jgi:nucleotide-binding universal stress UspA family protein
MTQKSTVPVFADSVHYKLAELTVAYDFSEAAGSCLKYAEMLAKRFGSSIHLLAVQSPAEYASALESGPLAMQTSRRDLQAALLGVQERLQAEGIRSDSARRIGNISDTIEGAILERTPDLLLLGAFGFGAVDRQHLGSTAEHLLRTVRCPVFVVGPHALIKDRAAPPIERILCPTSSLGTSDGIFNFSAHLAARLRASLELIYVVDPAQREGSLNDQQRYQEFSNELRARGIPVTRTVLYGRAEEAIAARAAETRASLILFELHRSGNRMVDCPDGVVSATIHRAHAPVMTVPSNLFP